MNKESRLRTISFTIYEKPIPWQRAGRHTNRCTYDPQKAEKDAISFLILRYLKQSSHFNGSFLEGPLHAIFKFYFKLPKTKRLREKKGLYHTVTPDLSNLIKLYEDIMSGLIYADDKTIFKIDAIKCYTSGKVRTEITIKEIQQADIINDIPKQEIIYDQKDLFVPAQKAK